MKKFVTIPFSTYQKLIKDKKGNLNLNNPHESIKENKVISEPQTINDSETVIPPTNSTGTEINKKKLSNNNIADFLPQNEPEDPAYSSSSFSLGQEGVSLPPPGIPKNKKGISIINHNTRITRNQGRWRTPWKTKFI